MLSLIESEKITVDQYKIDEQKIFDIFNKRIANSYPNILVKTIDDFDDQEIKFVVGIKWVEEFYKSYTNERPPYWDIIKYDIENELGITDPLIKSKLKNIFLNLFRRLIDKDSSIYYTHETYFGNEIKLICFNKLNEVEALIDCLKALKNKMEKF